MFQYWPLNRALGYIWRRPWLHSSNLKKKKILKEKQRDWQYNEWALLHSFFFVKGFMVKAMKRFSLSEPRGLSEMVNIFRIVQQIKEKLDLNRGP